MKEVILYGVSNMEEVILYGGIVHGRGYIIRGYRTWERLFCMW